MKRRDANLILIALAAVGGGVVAYVLPLSLFELALATSGLSERVPAFAPPLGDTARLLLTVAAAIACAGVAALVLPWGSASRLSGNRRERGVRFLSGGLVSLNKEPEEEQAAGLDHRPDTPLLADAPVLRRSDSHPDAPARQPLFARRDLGEEALPPVEAAASAPASEPERASMQEEAPVTAIRPETAVRQEAAEEPRADIDPPRAPEPLPWTLIEQEMSRILKGGRPRAENTAAEDEEAQAVARPVPAGDDEPGKGGDEHPSLATLPTIPQLVDRLERGLRRRKLARAVQGQVPGQAPDRPGPPERTGPAGEDLQRALEALRAAARAG